ncbi:PX domain-containing protein [Ditylenchus destructor]|uniref:PX domain-containing protein n=1 Tax=Ditylenchus destructor TaxID=166010 RepID=A0AAD4N6L8_9BILA|nr:PX domain-containing protein [Ditylenchus destructor]
MIHCTIPSFQALSDRRDPYQKYNVFDIHVNGAYHCSVRYSALFYLHEKLVDTFGFRLNAAEFPPKKVWRSLDNKATNERREALAKYFQAVLQNPDISKHTMLEKAFLDFQVSSFSLLQNRLDSSSSNSMVKLEIFLPDGRPTIVDCYVDDPTSAVMQKACDAIGMNIRYINCFGLFLGRPRNMDESNGSVSDILFDQICIRWLKNFESPYISQQLSNRNSDETGICHKLLVRRVTWDPSVEEPLLDDAGCVKVLFLQALNDIQRGILKISSDTKEKLSYLQEQGDFKQFIRLCHLQPSYGYELLAPVISDFPQDYTHCQLKVGRRQIVLEHQENEMIVQSILRSTRIRVWRVSQNNNGSPGDPEMSFQIEYLAGKNEFGTITLQTSQAVILSLFLQSIAAEILQDHPSPTYKFDDSVSTKAIEGLEICKANSVIGDNLSINDQTISVENGNSSDDLFKIISYQMPFDNESFEDITDTDL